MKRLLIISALLLIVLCACGDLNSSQTVPQQVEETIPEALVKNEAAPDDLTSLEKEASFQAEALDAFFKMKSYFKKNNTKESEDNMPLNYGGCRINDEGILVIYVVDLDDAQKEQYYTACESTDIMFQEVKYSLTELNEGMEALSAAMKAGTVKAFSGGINVEKNRVETTLGSKAEAEAAAKLMSDWPCIFFDYVEQPLTLSEYGETPASGDITITAEYDSYPTDTESINLFFTNSSDKRIYYDHYRGLEVLLDGLWYSIPYRPGVGSTLELLSLGEYTESHISVYFHLFNYEFTEGSYRIVLGYSYSDTGKYDNKCYAEFTLSKDAEIIEPIVLVNEGRPDNEEQISLFFRNYFAGMEASLSVKDAKSNTRYTYNGTALSVNGTYYPYCYIDSGSVFLTTYADIASADPEFIFAQDIVCIDNLVNLLSTDERLSFLDKIENEMEERRKPHTKQTALSENGKESVSIKNMEWHLDNGSTDIVYDVFFSRPGRGKTIDSVLEASGNPLPVYVFYIKDNVFGVVYKGTNEWVVKTYDTEEEAFIDTLTTADIESLLTETFYLTKSNLRKE